MAVTMQLETNSAPGMHPLKGGTRPLDGLAMAAKKKTRPEAAVHQVSCIVNAERASKKLQWGRRNYVPRCFQWVAENCLP